MKVSIVNKILLAIQIIPILLVLFLSLLLLGDSRPLFFIILLLSILSMVSVIYIILKTIIYMEVRIKARFIYLAHSGVLITFMGILVLLIDGNGFKELSANGPYSAFSVGLIVCVPYLHVMIIHRFFIHK